MLNSGRRLLAKLERYESGQGLVEYVLIFALIAFSATAGMGRVASGINSAFTQMAAIIGSYIT